jgi:hypothetical protein
VDDLDRRIFEVSACGKPALPQQLPQLNAAPQEMNPRLDRAR